MTLTLKTKELLEKANLKPGQLKELLTNLQEDGKILTIKYGATDTTITLDRDVEVSLMFADLQENEND